jgi:hypothetical protein
MLLEPICWRDARYLSPPSSPPGITQEEVDNGVYPGIAGQTSYYWIGNTSRDQYIGVFFGLGVAYNNISDSKFRARVSALGTRLLQFLLDHAWTVVMPDLRISTTFIGRPDQQLSLLQVGRRLNSSRFNNTYRSLAGLAAVSVMAPISLEVTDVHSSYFKFNLGHDQPLPFSHVWKTVSCARSLTRRRTTSCATLPTITATRTST